MKARDSADVKARFKTLGMEVITGDRNEYEARMRNEAQKRSELIRARNLKLD